MKKKVIILITIITISITSAFAQEDKITYPLVVKFQSECCGVPSDSAIRIFVSSFKKKYKVKRLSAYRIGPMGREGEYDLAFKLEELSKKQKTAFITNIKKVKKLSTDKGLFSFNEKMEIDMAAIPKRATSRQIIF